MAFDIHQRYIFNNSDERGSPSPLLRAIENRVEGLTIFMYRNKHQTAWTTVKGCGMWS